jgi:hypothetical protein
VSTTSKTRASSLPKQALTSMPSLHTSKASS